MYITAKELEAVHQAIDFIANKVDGAEDQEYYADILHNLTTLYNKGKTYRYNKTFKYYLKKALQKKPGH